MLYKRCACEDASKCLHPYWYKFQVNGQLHARSSKTANLRLATRAETNKKSAVFEDREGIKKPKPVRLSAHIDTYIEHTKLTNVTSYKDRGVLDRVEKIIGDRPLSDVTAFQIEKWKSTRANQVQKSTVNRELNIVRGCFSRAVDWKLIETSPAETVDYYKVDDQRVRVLDDDELRAVRDLADPFVALICRVTLESLGRISEVLGLHKTHIGAGYMEMRRKGGSIDRVPVTQELRTALLARCRAESGYVFGEGALGAVPTQQTASNRVLRALQDAGIQDASHHTMRHTGVTIMLEKGVNPRVIQKLAGWTSLRMLERYGHARDAEALRAVQAVSDHLGTNLGTAAESSISEIPATA